MPATVSSSFYFSLPCFDKPSEDEAGDEREEAEGEQRTRGQEEGEDEGQGGETEPAVIILDKPSLMYDITPGI